MVVVGAAVGLLVTMVLCPVVIRQLARRSVLDVPVARSSHTVAIPRGGGLAPAAGATAAGVLIAVAGSGFGWLLGIVVAALAFAALGLVDDIRTLPSVARLVAQVTLAVGTALLLAPRVATGWLMVAVVVASAFWVVAYVNAFNFMDGINGISVAQATVAGGAWALVGAAEGETVLVAAGLTVALAALAFLPFNFPVAKVFLGDVGSYFFGAWLAAMVLTALDRGLAPEMALAPVAVYLCDTGFTIVRRACRRAPLMEAHRDHVYQRLVDGGWSHARTVALVTATMVTVSLLGAVSMGSAVALRIAAGATLSVVLIGYLLAPYLFVGRGGRPLPESIK